MGSLSIDEDEYHNVLTELDEVKAELEQMTKDRDYYEKRDLDIVYLALDRRSTKQEIWDRLPVESYRRYKDEDDVWVYGSWLLYRKELKRLDGEGTE